MVRKGNLFYVPKTPFAISVGWDMFSNTATRKTLETCRNLRIIKQLHIRVMNFV